MNLDPFSKNEPSFPGIPGASSTPGKSKSSAEDVFVKSKIGGAGRRAPPPEEAEPMDMPMAETAPEPENKEKVVLRNPKWEASEVGFNEETEISVELQLPPEHANKKKVLFELFAKTPKDPERISQAEGFEEGGKATAKIPLYQPNFRDPDGNLLEKVEYYFTAKHSQSDLLKDPKATRTVDHKSARVIESHVLEDTTFDTDSSFLHPRNAEALAGLSERIAAWREKYPDGTLAVFGHTDAVGQEEYNKGLSERRARSVHAFLIKDVAVWEKLYGEEKWSLKQVQILLKHLGQDPGAIDGLDGPKTQAALKAFQEKAGLPVQAGNTAATRKDLFQAFADGLNDLKLDKKAFEDINGNPFTGCSEFNLLEETQGALEKNRRVTVLLLKSSRNFPVNYPCAMGDVRKCRAQVKKSAGKRRRTSFKCFFYDDLVIEEGGGGGSGNMPEFPDYDPGVVAKKEDCGCADEEGPVPGDAPAGVLKLVEVEDGKEVKQFVNLKADKPGQGSERLIEAEVEGAADGSKVFWKVTAAKENSKRNKPLPGVKPDAKGTLTAFKDGVAEIETTVAEGKTSLVLACGLAGGDVYTVEGGLEKGKADVKCVVINWRKIWYQLTHHKDIVPPSMATAKKQLLDVFIEWEEEPAAKHSNASPGQVIIGNHNAADYHKLLNSPHAGQCAHIILCDKQYDGLRGGSNIVSSQSTEFTDDNDSIQMSNPGKHIIVPNPPVQKNAKLFLSGAWENKATGKKGTLTDNPLKVTDDIGLAQWHDEHWWIVNLPKNAKPTAANPVTVELDATAASGPWGGDGGSAPHNLIVINADDTIHTQCCLHELGHIINMVPYKGYYKMPPGFSLGEPPKTNEWESTGDHTHSYDGARGGSGSHCSWEIDKLKSTLTRYVEGKCIMFHQLTKSCKLVYCPECAPLVKAQALEKFHDLKG